MKTEIYTSYHKQIKSSAMYLVLYYCVLQLCDAKGALPSLACDVVPCSFQSFYNRDIVVGARDILFSHFAFVLWLLALSGLISYGVNSRLQ